MADKYVLGVEFNGKTAGNKAQKDINQIAEDNGYKAVKYKIAGRRIRQFISKLNFKYALNRIPKNSKVLLQYPLAGRLETKIAEFIKERQDLFVILVIHDLDILRNTDHKAEIIIETEILRRADSIVFHNDKMREEVLKRVGDLQGKIMLKLNLFDYLCDCPKAETGLTPDKNSIVIAGNLNKSKSGYVYKLGDNSKCIKYHLYGINFEGNESDNVVYHGSFQPEELTQKLERGFGLVWDGEELDNCSGNFGEYLKYNNPHKLSLYIAAGIPVIVWSKSAIRHFVEQENIGIITDSILNLEEQIANLSDFQYQTMKQNAELLGEKVRQGYFTKCVLSVLEEAEK